MTLCRLYDWEWSYEGRDKSQNVSKLNNREFIAKNSTAWESNDGAIVDGTEYKDSVLS